MAVFRAATKSFLAPPNTRKSAVSVPPSGNGRLSVTPSPTRPPPQAAVCQRADSSNRHSLVAHSDLHAVPRGFLPRGLSDACPPLSGMRPPSHFRAGIRQPLTGAARQLQRSNDSNWPIARIQHPTPQQPFPHRPNNMTPINKQGVSHGNHQQARSLEQGKARRP
jgi:hypothetical protein